MAISKLLKRLFENRLFRFIFVIIGLVVIVNLIVSSIILWKKKDIVTERKEILKEFEKENAELQKKLEDVQSESFIEREAREKLGMAKEGEVVVLMENSVSKEEGSLNKEEKDISVMPNWKKWLELFK